MGNELANVGIQFAVAGAQAAAQQANEVSKAVANVGVSAEQATKQSAGLSSAFGGLTSRFVSVAAAAQLMRKAFSEFAEDEAAQVALTKIGVAAEDMARAGKLVEQIQWITGDKVAAAEMLGRVLNGNTRGLKQYGIELEENVGKMQLWDAAQRLAERGMETQAAKAETLTGQLEILGKQLGNNASDNIGYIASALSWKEAIEEMNIAYGAIQPIADRRAAQEKQRIESEKAAAAAKAEKAAFEEARTTIQALTSDIQKLTAGYNSLAAAAQRANQVSKSKRELEKEGKLTSIDEQVAAGKMSPEEAARQKATIEADASVMQARGDEVTAKDRAQELKRQKRETEDMAGEMEKSARVLPPEERKKAFTEIDKLYEAARQLSDDIKDAEAAAEVAGNNIKIAEQKRKGLQAQQTTEKKSEQKKADDEKAKAFEAAAKDVQKQQSKGVKEGSERGQAFEDFAGNIEKAADMAPSPEGRARLRDRAKKLRGGGSDEDIAAAEKEAGRILGGRSRSRTGNRAAEAQELQGKLSGSAEKAKEANNAGTDEVAKQGQAAAAELQAMNQALGPAFQAMLAAAQSTTQLLKQVEAKAKMGERTAGQGGG